MSYSEVDAITMIGSRFVKRGNELSFADQQAVKAAFVYRYTLDNIPQWARELRPDGTAYMPQFRSDQEWLANTWFSVNEHGYWNQKENMCCSKSLFPFGQVEQYPGQVHDLLTGRQRTRPDA